MPVRFRRPHKLTLKFTIMNTIFFLIGAAIVATIFISGFISEAKKQKSITIKN